MAAKQIDCKELKQIVQQILLRLDFADTDAVLLAEHLIESDLRGYHSHGVIRLPEYEKSISNGRIDPRAKITIETISPTIAFLNGNNAMGQLASIQAAQLAIDKAKSAGLAAVGMHHIAHTGRLGAFVQQIAEANMLGLYFCNGRTGINMQAPYGGSDAKLSTNPLALGAPRKDAAPLVLDMATTAIAYGKVLDAASKGVALPVDCALDQNGQSTTDPAAYLAGGALMPFGGDQAYKGFGLALFVEIFAGILSRAKMLSQTKPQDKNGGFMLAINVEHFLPLDLYFEEIEAVCLNLKDSKLRPGFSEIVLPGERSDRVAKQQRQTGISINENTWSEIEALLKKIKI